MQLTLNVLYHNTPHQLCRCEVKDVHGLQSSVSTHSEKRDSVLFTLSLQQQLLLTSALSKQNSVISLEEWDLVLKLFTTATRKFRVKPPRQSVLCEILASPSHPPHVKFWGEAGRGVCTSRVVSNKTEPARCSCL